MTICAGALCKYQGQNVVLVISDRMITAGDIEYPGPRPKIFDFGSPLSLCLSAGFIDVARMIADETRNCLSQTIVTDIAGVARLYAETYRGFRRRMAEQTLLSHLNLDADSFATQQADLNPEIARDLATRMENFDLGIQSIIAGVDLNGPHIYHIGNPGIEICLDHGGFASVGAGSTQFEPLFMSSGYSPDWELNQTLLLAYAAKKRAEVSPGVGTETDIRVCTRGGLGRIEQNLIDGLERLYQEYETNRQQLWNSALGNVHITVVDRPPELPFGDTFVSGGGPGPSS